MYNTRSRVYETVERPSVYVRLSHRSTAQQRCAAGLLLSARLAGDIDRLLHGALAAGARCSRHRSIQYRRSVAAAPPDGAQQQMSAVSR